MQSDKILVIGANGQLGSVLSLELQKFHGKKNVILSDINANKKSNNNFEIIDATDIKQIENLVKKHSVDQIYHLAAILSAKGEKIPLLTWDINMRMTLNVFEIAKKYNLSKVFFPSSIAVFGDKAKLKDTPQSSILNPATVYGMTKAAGENWAQYYFDKHGLDIRSIRYPGIIGYQSMPGGGTTDYSLEMYHSAVKKEKYICYLNSDTKLPMIYMEDAVRSTLEIMQSPMENISIRTSYNIASMSLSPIEIASEIQKVYPDFKVEYCKDFRQNIADKWPNSINDQNARNDWNWKPKYDLSQMTKLMLENLKEIYNTTT